MKMWRYGDAAEVFPVQRKGRQGYKGQLNNEAKAIQNWPTFCTSNNTTILKYTVRKKFNFHKIKN